MTASQPEVTIIVGTRPELIKLAGVIRALRQSSALVTRVIFTGQHTALLEGAATILDVVPDECIAPLDPGRSLTDLLAHTVEHLGKLLTAAASACVVVQGDTVSALAGAMTSELLAIPLVHVEAGVRSRLRDDPFPEETIRRIISSITELHVCFSEHTRQNLLGEGIDASAIVVAPHPLRDRVNGLSREAVAPAEATGRYEVLVTMHRRERRKLRAGTLIEVLTSLREGRRDLRIGFVWHPGLDADVSELRDRLESIGVEVVSPMAPDVFLRNLAGARLVITDSGGVAEEAQLLHLPLLVLRSNTEVRLDERPAAATIATEATDVAIEFATRSLAGRVGWTVDELAVHATAGLVIASHIADFATSQARGGRL